MNKSSQKGFTLIELIIAVGIFVLILQIVAGAYGRFVRVEREGIGQQEMQEDVRLFLQLFNREARTAFGNTYQRVVSPQFGVVFRNQENDCVLYHWQNGAIFRTDTTQNTSLDPKANCADLNIYPKPGRRLTDEKNTVIDSLSFEAIAAQPLADPAVTNPGPLTQQGKIIVYLTVRANAATAEPMMLQSTVTSRQFVPYIPI